MARIITLIKSYRIRNIEQLQIIIFWITLVSATLSLFYLIWES